MEPLQLDWTPAEAVVALRGDAFPFVLDGQWNGGCTVIGSEPVRVAHADEDPFALLDELPEVRIEQPVDGAIGGGWFGYLGFQLAHSVERLPPDPPAAAGILPPFALAYYDHVLRLDAGGQWWFEALEAPGRAAELRRRREELIARRPKVRPVQVGSFVGSGPGTAGMHLAVADCLERISAGELFQANLALSLRGSFTGDPLDAFAAGLGLRPAYAAFLGGPWGSCLGLSPELFLRRRGREVISRPIKGTRPRAPGDLAMRAELERSAKDRAENVMIVDLMRSDLGRVSAYGSVQADPIPIAEPHPGVWHLVSTVRGTLRDDVGNADLLRATFPPGSVTGAPKVQALRVISELESSARGAYTGAAGYASPVSGLELNVAIRTFEIKEGCARIGAGGGIVADSDPEAEVREALDKARPLIAALGGRLQIEASGQASRNHRRLPRALEGGAARPDPEEGVFETIAVKDGQPVALDRHLERLAASVKAVLDVDLPGTLRRDALNAAKHAGSDRQALRIDVSHADVDLTFRSIDIPHRIDLAPVVLPGGLGPHKWRDRELVDTLRRRHRAVPLFVDSDGAVLEAGDGNVFIVEGDRLITPPADGRILPGTTRARILSAAENAEEDWFYLDRLLDAEAVLVTSAVARVRVGRSSRRPELGRAIRTLVG